MTYSVGGNIQASDITGLVGTSPGTTSNKLNTVWAVGGSSAGYGQSAITVPSVGAKIAATDWSTLVSATANSAAHQSTSISAMTTPAAGGSVAYQSALTTNITSIYTNKLNAVAQGTSAPTILTNTSTVWNNYCRFDFTVAFASGDEARYFFNAGGQLAFTCYHTPGANIYDTMFYELAGNVGTIVISSLSSSTATIVGTSYNGVTKVGGGGNAPTISTNSGYYGTAGANTTIFTQVASSGPSGYINSYISLSSHTNGTVGSNADNGDRYYASLLFQKQPAGGSLYMLADTTATLTVRPPSTTYVANTWHTVSVSGSVTAT